METSEFDAAMGGNEHLPHTANNLKFAASRSIEIAAMTESILRPSKTKLIFQTLPTHMRRRVMSHNCKRLPRKLREGHLEQLKKSGLPPKQKRPSRKYRRRPANLLDEYNRRQQRNIWLETHIWHAKRFHMIERWGYRLASAPCDKAFRACYRASSAHCLMQDISYFTPIQVMGPVELIKDIFDNMTSGSSGLNICAKAYTNGNREGSVHIYNKKSFPFDYIGQVNFIWVNTDSKKALWLFVHPSQTKQVELVLSELLCSDVKFRENGNPEKRRKLSNNYSDSVQMKVYVGVFNRFRLTGPNSHAILIKSLKCVPNKEKLKFDKWTSLLSDKSSPLFLEEKYEYWQAVSIATSPAQLPPKIVVGLVVRDPRLSRPAKRTKAKLNYTEKLKTEYMVSIPPQIASSPLWDHSIHEEIKKNKLNNTQYIEHITKTQLIPGEINEEDTALQTVPVVLIQRPGSQKSEFKKIGYGNGWDIIVPSAYGLPFWQTFIMFGARAGGLRETESLAFEMGEYYLPPDSKAGKSEERRIELEMRDKYFRLPPSKRVNFIKLAIPSPFICPWKVLLADWSNNSIENFFVLRERHLLKKMQECVDDKRKLPEMDNCFSCLVPIYLQLENKGHLKNYAVICLPNGEDILCIKNLVEPRHEDPNEKLRKMKRAEHLKTVKRLKRNQIKLRKQANKIKTKIPRKCKKSEMSDFVKSMRELWLPSNINTVRYSSSRETMGFLVRGAFSFTEARSCGLGYVAYCALSTLLNSGINQVIVRNPTSRKYRLAKIRIIE